ncbi:MAG: GNAT family N-acetyltransferase [Lachnospiraceae bacterium]|nr:GNAT family N-acetyltransferase [Lachnospiraceae bacterium]
MRIEAVTKDNYKEFGDLMLPYIFDEFSGEVEETDTEYFGLAAVLEEGDEDFHKAHKTVASVLIVQPETIGDLNIVSIYTVPALRGKGYASMLFDKSVQVARQLFSFDEDETEETIVYKTLYRLPEETQDIYEAFLIKNHFRDFYLVEQGNSEEEGKEYDVWSAAAFIKFFKQEG